MRSLNFSPIGFFHGSSSDARAVPRQPNVDESLEGFLELCLPNYSDCISDLDGFSHIWLVFLFHQNESWNPKILPPRLDRKVGVFATRSPHRPNPIGLSLVKIKKIFENRIYLQGHDLLDGTPVLDIKPYIHQYDSIIDSRNGWLDEANSHEFNIQSSEVYNRQISFLSQSIPNMADIIIRQLRSHPLDYQRKRVKILNDQEAIFSYKTWRIHFSYVLEPKALILQRIQSGYSDYELQDLKDPYNDKELHRSYLVFCLDTNGNTSKF